MIYFKQGIIEFTYSNIVSTIPDYSPATNYLLGDLVRIGSYHYKSLYGTVALPNTNNYPLNNLNTAWFEFEPSNIYACLDPYMETKTTWVADGIMEFERSSKDTLALGGFTASLLTIEYLDEVDEVITSETQTYSYSNNFNVYDEWTYAETTFQSNSQKLIYHQIKEVGKKIRVTLSNGGNPTDLGFICAGIAEYKGETLSGVRFPDKTIGNKTIKTATFTTSMDRTELMSILDESRLDRQNEETMVFIIDENPNSDYGNMIILGKIIQVDGGEDTFTENQINWEVEQKILT